MSTKTKWQRFLTDDELLQMLENDDFDAVLPPLDNSEETDLESDDGEPMLGIGILDQIRADSNNLDTKIQNHNVEESTEVEEPEEPEEPGDYNDRENIVDRKWSKHEKCTEIPNYVEPQCIWEDVHFRDCNNAIDIFIKLLANTLEDITFQSNLYATQKGKQLNMSKEELLAFIGINFLMGYHVLPSVPSYWSTQDDLAVPFVGETMPRNRFQTILSFLHINDNTSIPNNNTDRLYKVRPLLDALNSQFKNYCGGQKMCVDESIIKFKGRSSIKQYNPMKPVKRGYKLWCYSDMEGFIKKFDVYQGKNETVNDKYKSYGLGERVVLWLTEEDWKKNKIIYFDNFYTTVKLLEKLKTEETLACGTLRSNRKYLPKKIAEDKKLRRGDFDYRVSNTGISFFKWKDNRVVTIASNFHGTESITLKRKERDGTGIEVSAPAIIKDYNESMGGVDHHDQLRQCFGLDRRSRKWWQRIFWGCMEITFINSFIIAKKMSLDSASNLLDFRRDLTRSLCYMSPYRTNKRKSASSTSSKGKKRRYNYSVPSGIRLSNLGSHWPKFVQRRGRCELCSSRGIQSKPSSTCSLCKVFLCVNQNTNCFALYHDINRE